MVRYVRFHGTRHPSELSQEDVVEFLSALAIRNRVSASTQNQAMAAISFLYREVLATPLEELRRYGGDMTELLAAAALIITVLVAYLQLQKSQQASLRLQEGHLRNELKLKLYERFSAILFDASTALSEAGMQYYSILSTLRSRVEHGFNTSPTSTGADLSENAHAAQRALNRVVILLEEYEMAFARFQASAERSPNNMESFSERTRNSGRSC